MTIFVPPIIVPGALEAVPRWMLWTLIVLYSALALFAIWLALVAWFGRRPK